MRHSSEAMKEWLADYEARLFSLWRVRQSGDLRMMRGGLLRKHKGGDFVFAAFDREFLDGARACLRLAGRSPEWRQRALAGLVLLFEGAALEGLEKVKADIRRRGLNDFNACDLESFKRMDAAKEAGELLNGYLALCSGERRKAR